MWLVQKELKNAYIGEYNPPYKYIKWYITANRGNLSVTQMSEFELCDANWTKMSRPALTTITWSIVWPGSETVDKLIDGSTSTKYCPNGSLPITITITLWADVDFSTYNKYRWYTANDYNTRDPISWTLSLSSDGSNWTEVSNISNATITTNRYALAWTWDITL